MKSFDEIVDGLWKPFEPTKDYSLTETDVQHQYIKVKKNIRGRHEYLKKLYLYHNIMHKSFYGRDVQEPVVKICKRILEKPNRFHLVKEGNVYRAIRTNGITYPDEYTEWCVIQDKDTQQKFVRRDTGGVVSNLSCLTYDEQVLLTAVLCEWYNHQKQILAKKKDAREEKRKERFRKELSDLYEEY